MGRYILRRILLFIPTLFFISLLAFIISVNAPGDPVDQLLNLNQGESSIGYQAANIEKARQDKRIELGLNLPVFYFSLGTLADIDTLYRIANPEWENTVTRLSRRTGNKSGAVQYYSSLQAAISTARQAGLGKLGQEEYDVLNRCKHTLESLLRNADDNIIRLRIDSLHQMVTGHPSLQYMAQPVHKVAAAYADMNAHRHSWVSMIPAIHLYGWHNQYHRWLSRLLLHGDLGTSYRDKRPVMEHISQRFAWSFSLSFFSLILAYLISIPLGVMAARYRGSLFDRGSSIALFMLHSLPSFLVGLMLILLFANKDVFQWFPESGIQDPGTFHEDWPLWQKIAHWAPHLILPIITYTYGQLAFLSRFARSGMLEILDTDYIRTARAKGLPERTVVWKHAFRNALLSLITVFTSLFPLAIAGAVIIETIFSIPGMGLEIVESIASFDYPVIVGMFTISGFIVVCSYLLSDILYAFADPRISYR